MSARILVVGSLEGRMTSCRIPVREKLYASLDAALSDIEQILSAVSAERICLATVESNGLHFVYPDQVSADEDQTGSRALAVIEATS